MLIVVWLTHHWGGIVKDGRRGIWDRVPLLRIFNSWILLGRGEDIAENSLSWLPSGVELVCVALLSWVLLWIQAVSLCNGHFKYIVHVTNSYLPASIGWDRAFLIFLKSHMIVLNGFCEITSLVLTCTTCICCIDMIGINFKNSCEIIYALFELPDLFKGTPSYIVCSRILRIKLHQWITVLNGLCEPALLQEWRCAYK